MMAESSALVPRIPRWAFALKQPAISIMIRIPAILQSLFIIVPFFISVLVGICLSDKGSGTEIPQVNGINKDLTEKTEQQRDIQ
jgi:hypothetical protein